MLMTGKVFSHEYGTVSERLAAGFCVAFVIRLFMVSESESEAIYLLALSQSRVAAALILFNPKHGGIGVVVVGR